MYTLREKVLWFACISRICMIIIQIICNAAIPDHNADAFVSPKNPSDKVEFLDNIVFALFGGFVHWDSEYFLHVARYGYTHENCIAFFPLYPLCIRLVATLLNFVLGPLFNPQSVLLISCLLLNGVLFSWAALVLFDLTFKIFCDKGMAYRSAILFCVSPASVFFVSPYSETLFAFLSFRGMIEVEEGLKGTVSSSIPFGLAAATRSNGLANVGFTIHAEARHITDVTMNKGWQAAIINAANSFWRLFLGVCIMVAPFATFQGYATVKFCIPNPSGQSLPDFLKEYTAINNLTVPGVSEPPAWCNSSSMALPYTAVQSNYWNVGFLRYYHWKQIPNFLLAIPMAVLVISGSRCFFQQHKALCYNLGLWKPTNMEKKKQLEQSIIQNEEDPSESLLPPRIFVYIAHALILLILCFLFIHVQVTTRLISSASPIPYWFAAYFISPFCCSKMKKEDAKPNMVLAHLREYGQELQVETAQNLCSLWKVFIISDLCKHSSFMALSRKERIISKLTQMYFLSYAIIGIALFCNNLPWT